MQIIVSAVFAVGYTLHMITGYTPGQLIFGLNMILPIKYIEIEYKYASVRIHRLIIIMYTKLQVN